jgi:hypothetical protein
VSLQSFDLDDLGQFTAEGEFSLGSPPDYRGFYVGRDDVHGVIMALLGACSISLKLTMFGFDDDEANAAIMALVAEPRVMVQVTLDKSQASGVHEKKILTGDVAMDPLGFAYDFAVGTSDTHQIQHTKGMILDGLVAVEGSTNWSASGEGEGIGLHGANRPGYKAQENTLLVHTNPVEIAKFGARLDYAHAVARHQKQPDWLH